MSSATVNAHDQQIVSWVEAHQESLEKAYHEFMAQTGIQLSYSQFCINSFYQPPITQRGPQ